MVQRYFERNFLEILEMVDGENGKFLCFIIGPGKGLFGN